MGAWLAARLAGWLDICLLRRAPQDEPWSPAALLLALAAYTLVDLLVAAASSGWRVAAAMTAVDLALLVAFVWMLLRLMGRPARFVQTLTALAGSGSLLGVAALPLVQQAARAQAAGGEASGGLALMWLLLVVWSLVVRAHIFRHALSAAFVAGAMAAVIHAAMLFGLIEYLFPRVS